MNANLVVIATTAAVSDKVCLFTYFLIWKNKFTCLCLFQIFRRYLLGTPIINLELFIWHTFKLLVKVGLFVSFFCLQIYKTFHGSRNNEFTGMFTFLIFVEFDWSGTCISTGCHQAILIYFMNQQKFINLCKNHFFFFSFLSSSKSLS